MEGTRNKIQGTRKKHDTRMEKLLKYFSDFSEKQMQQFGSLLPLYKDWNEKINVISRKDMDNFYEHHVLHSLAIATQFSFEQGERIMDLGTGGGFPGIPLAIFFPEAHFYLVDSINKKLKVINEVAAATGILNITTLHKRAEDIHDLKFDTVISRAVAPLKELWQWSKPLIDVRSRAKSKGLICLKGGDLKAEIAQSGLKPMVWELGKVFEAEFFREKYMLWVKG